MAYQCVNASNQYFNVAALNVTAPPVTFSMWINVTSVVAKESALFLWRGGIDTGVLETAEPVFRSPTLHVVGLNSVRAWRHQSGGINEAQLARAEARLQEAPAGALRIVALHHQMVGAPWRSRKRPVARRTYVLARLVDSGAELILGGHIHQAAVSERHEFEVVDGRERGVVVSIAPGLGQPRPRRRGEARGLQVYTVEEGSLLVETFIWRGDGWQLTAARRFRRGAAPLVAGSGPLGDRARGDGDQADADQHGEDEADEPADDQTGDQY